MLSGPRLRENKDRLRGEEAGDYRARSTRCWVDLNGRTTEKGSSMDNTCFPQRPLYSYLCLASPLRLIRNGSLAPLSRPRCLVLRTRRFGHLRAL